MIFIISEINSNDHWLIYLILSIIVLTLIVFLVIVGHRIHFALTENRIEIFKSKLSSLLSGAVNYPEKSLEYKTQIKGLLKAKWQYEILLRNLTTMCYSFRGVYEDRVRDLYEYHGLSKMSDRKLKSRRWDEVVEGIIELSIFGSSDAYKKILPLLEHKEWQVRKQSKIAIVELGEQQGLIEMESKIGTMTRWTYISILAILHRSAFRITPENLEILRGSGNPSARKLVPFLEKYAVIYS